MSRQGVLVVVLLAVVFGCGVEIGPYFDSADPHSVGEGASRSDVSASSSAADESGDLKGNKLLSDRIRELEKQLGEQKQEELTSVADRMAFFKKYRNDLRVQPMVGNRALSPEMAEILGLSKEEKREVDQRLSETDDAMTKLDTSNEFVAKQDATGVTIETPADPKGKEIEDGLVNSLNASIGEDRANFLMSYMGDSSSEPFGGFAQAKKDLEITWANKNGKLTYTIKNQNYNPKGEGNSASWYDTPEIPQQYQKYFSSDSAKTP